MIGDPEIPRLGRRMWKRFLGAAVLIVLLTGSATATAALLEVQDYAAIFDDPRRPAIDVRDVVTRTEAGQPQTILLLGSDSRVADRRRGIRGNSDTMILVRLDPDKQANAVLSIPRDLKVSIPLPNGGVAVDKINQAYAIGGPRLTIKTISETLDIDINHVVNVNFRAFREVVSRIGCVYTDVDRRYFNDNPYAYATINVQPGYQKMCGDKALDYVRFRHEDNDLVRAARQQDFLRQAKEQASVQRIIGDRKGFARLFAKYTETDIRTSEEILRLFNLVAFSAGNPIREVQFRTRLGPSFVASTESQMQATVDEFLNAEDTTGPRGTLSSTSAERETARRQRKLPRAAAGMEEAKRYGEEQAIAAAAALRFPVLFPRLRTQGSVYVDVPRTYALIDEEGNRHEAYRMVMKKGAVGEYYGVQGTTWKDPPMLRRPSEKRRIGPRRFDLFFDGDRLRTVALRTPTGTYWVSNTLLLSLSNAQMLAMARTLQPVARG